MTKKSLAKPKANKVTIKPRSTTERAFWLLLAVFVGVGLLLLFTSILATVILKG